VQIDYFYGIGCTHCAKVADSGVLNKLDANSTLVKHEVYYDVKGQERFSEIQDFLNVKSNEKGVPFMMVNNSGNYTYLVGDAPIIANAVEYSKGNFVPIESGNKRSFFQKIRNILSDGFYSQIDKTTGKLSINGLFFLGLLALIDAINPCAFGVLIFLMISLLKTGSSRRALKYGLIYSFVVFIVYFFAGLGIFKVIQSLSILRRDIYLFAAIIVFIFAFLEFIDFYRAGKSDKKSILKIPLNVKPLLENTAKKGTLIGIITLGVLVSLFELPCTGGVYLGTLSSLATINALPYYHFLGYLLVYNIIFIIPLIVITFMVYKGTSPEILQRWTNSEKRWMKLAAGIVLLLIGIYLLINGL
jgi:cytochrome c biogenesis protein CcdA